MDGGGKLEEKRESRGAAQIRCTTAKTQLRMHLRGVMQVRDRSLPCRSCHAPQPIFSPTPLSFPAHRQHLHSLTSPDSADKQTTKRTSSIGPLGPTPTPKTLRKHRLPQMCQSVSATKRPRSTASTREPFIGPTESPEAFAAALLSSFGAHVDPFCFLGKLTCRGKCHFFFVKKKSLLHCNSSPARGEHPLHPAPNVATRQIAKTPPHHQRQHHGYFLRRLAPLSLEAAFRSIKLNT
jgi:hypothetical protein